MVVIIVSNEMCVSTPVLVTKCSCVRVHRYPTRHQARDKEQPTDAVTDNKLYCVTILVLLHHHTEQFERNRYTEISDECKLQGETLLNTWYKSTEDAAARLVIIFGLCSTVAIIFMVGTSSRRNGVTTNQRDK